MRPLDTVLDPLADNGGLTLTHALAAGSPAIDAGNNDFSVDAGGAALTTDQRGAGFLRISDVNADIGAFEVNPELAALMVSCEIGPGPAAIITWRSTEGKSYDVLCSTDLQNWFVIATDVPAEPGDMTSFTDETPPPNRAYFIARESK